MDALIEAISDFRKEHNISEANWSNPISYSCLLHCVAMSERYGLYHAPEEYRDWCSECCATSTIFLDTRDQIRHMMFSLFGSSPSHTQIILQSTIIGAAYFTANNRAYITLRGKEQ